MALSWNEIKERAIAFSKKWEDATNEDSEAKPFLIDFFNVFGVSNDIKANCLAVPTTSSENRRYIPIAFLKPDIIASNQLYIIPNITPFLFDLYTKYNSTLFAKQPKVKKKSPTE